MLELTSGSAPVRLIVPVTLNLMISSPAWLLAAVIASRRLVTAGLRSTVSASVLTVKVAGSSRASSISMRRLARADRFLTRGFRLCQFHGCFNLVVKGHSQEMIDIALTLPQNG